jgi:hypothetical protein
MSLQGHFKILAKGHLPFQFAWRQSQNLRLLDDLGNLFLMHYLSMLSQQRHITAIANQNLSFQTIGQLFLSQCALSNCRDSLQPVSG